MSGGGWVRGRRPRLATALLIARLPSSALRKAAYTRLLGYRFGPRCRIGYGTVVAVDRFVCGEAVVIWSWNSFHGPIAIEIGDHSYIGKRNQICCGHVTTEAWAAGRDYARRLTLGRRCLVNEDHIFDLVGAITIGDGTWIAGFRSQLLTHGAGVMDRDIVIGRDCFVGSAVLIAPGASIGDRCMVGMGSVVTRKLDHADAVIAGVPARMLRPRSADDGYQFERTW